MRDINKKNYHSWSYHTWLLAHFDKNALWAGGLPFVENMIAANVQNSSVQQY